MVGLFNINDDDDDNNNNNTNNKMAFKFVRLGPQKNSYRIAIIMLIAHVTIAAVGMTSYWQLWL